MHHYRAATMGGDDDDDEDGGKSSRPLVSAGSGGIYTAEDIHGSSVSLFYS